MCDPGANLLALHQVRTTTFIFIPHKHALTEQKGASSRSVLLLSDIGSEGEEQLRSFPISEGSDASKDPFKLIKNQNEHESKAFGFFINTQNLQ